MQTLIRDIKSGIIIGLFSLITIFVGGLIAYAAGRSTISPTTITNDTSLFTDVGNNLTSNKRNELVNKVNNNKGLDNAKVLTCIYSAANAGAVGWKSKVWTASDCGGVNIPSDFSHILSSLKRVDGTGIQNGIANCTPTTGLIFLDTVNLQIVLECSYLVRN